MMHSAVGMHINYTDWVRTTGVYLFHRDLAISDAVHEGVENYVGPEIEEELDQLYLEVFLQKRQEELAKANKKD